MRIRFFLICTFLSAIFTTEAQELEWLSEAEKKAGEGDFLSASILYERILFSNPPDSVAYAAVWGKLACFKRQAKFAEAEKYLHGALLPGFTEEQRFALSVQQVLCAYLSAQFEQTISLSEQLPVNFPSARVPDLVAVMKVLSLNELRRWPEASAAYRQWAMNRDPSSLAPDPYLALPKFKSESKAEWLSTFIPGGGQIYAGKPWEGLAGIVVQGAGIWFGVVSFLDGYYLSAWAGAGLFGSFHMGGVRRSTVLVQRYNKKQMARFNRQVRTAMLGSAGGKEE